MTPQRMVLRNEIQTRNSNNNKNSESQRITNIPLFLEITITLYHLTGPLFYIMVILRLASNVSPKKAIQIDFPTQIFVVFELQSAFRS